MLRPSALSMLAVVASCAPSYDVNVAWTVDGEDPKAVCRDDDDVRISIDRDLAAGGTEETFALAKCVDGEARVQAGGSSTMQVELLDGEDSIGASRPVPVQPAVLGDDDVVSFDIVSTRGTLRARLLLAGRSCDVAGASTFEVALSRTSDGIEDELVADHVEVTCEDGDALYIDHEIVVGARYHLQATTTLDGDVWSTPEPAGADIRTDSRETFVDVDLRRVDELAE